MGRRRDREKGRKEGKEEEKWELMIMLHCISTQT